MALANRQKPYQALTTINLPFIERLILPGEPVEIDDLKAAQQTDEDVEALISNGALGEEGDELHPSTIIPDPSVPTIQSVVAQARAAMEELKAAGEKVPSELKAVAELDFNAVTGSERGSSSDRSA